MSNVDIARRAFDAFSQGDLATVKDSFADKVVWISSDSVKPGGERRGLDAIMQLFAEIPEHWKEFGLEPSAYIDAGDHVVVIGNQRVSSSKGSMSGRFACLLKYDRAGKVTEGEFFADTAKAQPLQV